MSFLHTAAAFVVALGVLIVVHEYGHYLAARLCKVRVLRFSVGFGRPLVTWRSGRDATEWTIAAIPFGGYVKMLDERESPVAPQDLPRAFNRQGVGRRFLIVAAGPAFNFLFAIGVYASLYMYGLPEARPVLAQPAAGTVAQAAGLRAGATVRAIDGQAVATWQDLRWRVLQAVLQREAVRVEVSDASGNISLHVLDLRGYPSEDVEADAMERIGLRLYRPPLAPVLGKIVSGGAAQRAGLKEGDRITHAGGAPVRDWGALVQLVRSHPSATLRLAVERDGARLAIDVVPDAVSENGAKIGRIGAAPLIPAA
ncbi:MAG: RIP metalloprotease RseP, partial [Burkholderiales bacterium]|nr:RIP metalloprotease RseP [Burkholderiales bacterium]